MLETLTCYLFFCALFIFYDKYNLVIMVLNKYFVDIFILQGVSVIIVKVASVNWQLLISKRSVLNMNNILIIEDEEKVSEILKGRLWCLLY